VKRFFIILASVCTIAALVIFDQYTKVLALTLIQGKGAIQVLGDFVILVFARNRGAFLSLGSGASPIIWYIVFVILPVLAMVLAFLYVHLKKPYDALYQVGSVLLISGGLGNIVDRIRDGSVVDFMNIGIGAVLRSGIFNVADLYIVFLVILVVIVSIINPKKVK